MPSLAKPRAAEAPRMRNNNNNNNRAEAYQRIEGQLRVTRSSLRRDLQSINARHEPSASAAYNIPDGAQAHTRVDEQMMTMEQSGISLERVQAAIERIQEGTYGRCIGCGCLIPLRRLNAVPTTETCVSCATERERNGGTGNSNSDAERFALLAEMEGTTGETVAQEDEEDGEDEEGRVLRSVR